MRKVNLPPQPKLGRMVAWAINELVPRWRTTNKGLARHVGLSERAFEAYMAGMTPKKAETRIAVKRLLELPEEKKAILNRSYR